MLNKLEGLMITEQDLEKAKKFAAGISSFGFPLEGTVESIQKSNNSKYTREIVPNVFVDVYDVLQAFEVHNPGIAHAVKKLLCPGQRGVKDKVHDIKEAIGALERAVELEEK